MIEPAIFKFKINGDRSQLPFWSLTQGCSEFVYIVQETELLDGADIVLWLVNQDGDVKKRIYATGGIIPFRPLGSIELCERLESESRWDWIARSVETNRPKRSMEDIRKDLQEVMTTWDPLIDRIESVSRKEFDTVYELAGKIQEGNGNLLGLGEWQRVIAFRGGAYIDWCTWEGNVDPEILWDNVHDILQAGGILELETRQLK